MYRLIVQPREMPPINCVQRISDGAFIPFADGNCDYEEYKLWLAEGNTPLPAVKPEIRPSTQL